MRVVGEDGAHELAPDEDEHALEPACQGRHTLEGVAHDGDVEGIGHPQLDR